MKKLLLFAALLVTGISFSQVGIGTTIPDTSAQLDVTSTSKGFMPPRMTYAQKTAIATPGAGLIVWCTNCGTNGEMQCYNGTTWTNISGTTASFGKPSAPTSPVATAGNSHASIAFSAPASNGGTVITGYTVTSDPASTPADGQSSPITVSGLTNGTSYTFTVVATNVAGNSVASTASTAVVIPNCGAYVSAGVFKVFACYNLGATDTTVDSNTPVQGIHGNYYQWGRSAVVATGTAAGAISGWNTTAAANGDWTDGSKTNNDPCPTGFRVPTNVQWQGVIANNTVSRTGSWNNDSNFTTAISFGTSTTKTLTLPAAGYRNNSNGTLTNRGLNGYYWSSTENTATAWCLKFSSESAGTIDGSRTFGFSVRCVSE